MFFTIQIIVGTKNKEQRTLPNLKFTYKQFFSFVMFFVTLLTSYFENCRN